jgi:hypothetical protein
MYWKIVKRPPKPTIGLFGKLKSDNREKYQRELDAWEKEYGDQQISEMKTIVNNIICPECLKAIVTNNITIACPYCDTEFDSNCVSDIKTVIYDQCPTCHGEIKYLVCVHCQHPIDLLDHNYDYEYLKRERAYA